MTKSTTVKFSVGIREAFDSFEKPHITYQQYRDVINEHCDYLFDRLCEGYQVKIGSMGYIKLVRSKFNRKPINWTLTNKFYGEENKHSEVKKRIYHRNDHTDNFIVYPAWNNKSNQLKRKSFFRFHLSRKKKIELAALLKMPGYIEKFDSV